VPRRRISSLTGDAVPVAVQTEVVFTNNSDGALNVVRSAAARHAAGWLAAN